MTSEEVQPEDLDMRTEITTLLDSVEETPDGFGLYLNFVFPLNTDSNGVVNETSPYLNLEEELAGEDSQTRFLLTAMSVKHNLQLRTAFLRDPQTGVSAGYHYGFFYVGSEIVDTFMEIYDDLEVELANYYQSGKVPVLPNMQFSLLNVQPDDFMGEVESEDEDLF